MILRFDDFELDEELFELRRRGEPLPVQRRVLETLFYLVRHRGRLVTREELVAGPWAGTAVTDSAITQAIKHARMALANHGSDEQSVIRTVRGKGVRFVAEVVEEPELRHAPHKTSDAARDQPAAFVGRDEEMTRFREHLEAAVAGAGRSILVGGEAGIGKTALVDRAAREAAGLGMRLLRGRAWKGGDTPAFWPWVEAARGLLESADFQRLGRPVPGSTDWLDLGPGRSKDDPGPDEASDLRLDAKHARLLLFDSITRFFLWVASDAPLLIVLEDLHAADGDSLAAWRFLIPRIRDARLLLIGTFRPQGGRIQDFVGDRPDVDWISLGGLGPKEVEQLVRITARSRFTSDAAARIHAISGGNPFIVRELAAGLRASDEAAGADSPPMAWRTSLDRRISGLPHESASLLESACVVGMDFDVSLVARMAGVEPREALAHLAPAIDRRIVGAEETTPGAYRFVHALLRDAVDARLTPERRCDLHARCAEALKSQGCLDDEHTYRVARHYWLASPLSGRDRARQWALAAAECARRAHAHELESEQLGHAVQLGAQGGVDAAVQIDCLIGLGQAQFHAGRHADAIASFDRAAAMCRALGDNARFARAVIGRFEVFGETAPTDPQLAAMLAEALELLPEETPTRAILLSAHAFSRFLVPRDRDRWKEGLRLARKTGSSAALARALGIGARSTVQGAPLLDLADELIPAAEQAKESAAVFEGHLSRWSALLQMGRLAEWQAESRAFELLVSHLRHPVWQYRWSMMAAVQTLLKGDLPTAYEGARRARARGEQLGDPVAPAFFGVVAYSLWRAAEPAPDAEPWLREVEDIAARMVQWLPDYLPWRVLMTLIDLTRGRVDAARREYRQIVASGFDTIPADWNYVANLHTLAQAAPRFGTPDEIERLYELLLPFAGQHVVPTFGYFGPVDRELGGLRRTLGDESAAKTHLERALAEVEAIEARPWIDRLKRELAGRS